MKREEVIHAACSIFVWTLATLFVVYSLSSNKISLLGSIGDWISGLMTPVIGGVSIYLVLEELKRNNRKDSYMFKNFFYEKVSKDVLQSLDHYSRTVVTSAGGSFGNKTLKGVPALKELYDDNGLAEICKDAKFSDVLRKMKMIIIAISDKELSSAQRAELKVLAAIDFRAFIIFLSYVYKIESKESPGLELQVYKDILMIYEYLKEG